MRLAPLLKALLLAAIALELSRILVARNGVGIIEWIIGIGLVIVLATGAAQFTRKSFRSA